MHFVHTKLWIATSKGFSNQTTALGSFVRCSTTAVAIHYHNIVFRSNSPSAARTINSFSKIHRIPPTGHKRLFRAIVFNPALCGNFAEITLITSHFECARPRRINKTDIVAGRFIVVGWASDIRKHNWTMSGGQVPPVLVQVTAFPRDGRRRTKTGSPAASGWLGVRDVALKTGGYCTCKAACFIIF